MIEPAVRLSAYRLTFEDWIRLPDDGQFYELLDGDLFVAPPPSISHQRIARDLGYHLEAHLRETGQGEMLHAPVGVKLSENDVVEPDLLVVLSAHRDRIRDQAVEGSPDLVVEILSPGTATRDLGIKMSLYERAGVPEYWIVDPRDARVEVLHLEQGSYRTVEHLTRSDVLRSHVLEGFELALSEIFPTPLH